MGKRNQIIITIIMTCLFAAFPIMGISSEGAKNHENIHANIVKIEEAYGKIPLSFEANNGQTNKDIKFLSRGPGYSLFLAPSEAVLSLNKAWVKGKDEYANPKEPEVAKQAIIRMRLVGANPVPQVVGINELPGKSNYFIGNDPKNWHTNIPTYAGVKYEGVYPGIDLVYYGNQRQLEYDFIVSPGANLGVITLAFEGTKRIELNSHGDLVLRTSDGEVIKRKPLIYQEVEGIRKEIAGGYILKSPDEVSFQVATYDTSKPFIIDPVLTYSTYLGGGGTDESLDIAVDAGGNAYVTGRTFSPDFPTTPGAFQTTFIGPQTDVFVTKVNSTGNALIYSTFIGGSGTERGLGIEVDVSGNAYVTGETFSPDFPTTLGAFQTISGGGGDAFVTKLALSGNSLVYSTFLGGTGDERGNSIAVDVAGNAYVTGSTSFSTDFPTTPGAFQTTARSFFDSFMTKLDSTGSTLFYSTYLGGSLGANSKGIAIDAAGNAYVTGNTDSVDFSTTIGAYQTTLAGSSDAFVTKLNALGSTLIYSTFLGGSDSDLGNSIAVDATGNAYVMGQTSSANFPTTPGAFQTTLRGNTDVFVTKLNTLEARSSTQPFLVVQVASWPV